MTRASSCSKFACERYWVPASPSSHYLEMKKKKIDSLFRYSVRMHRMSPKRRVMHDLRVGHVGDIGVRRMYSQSSGLHILREKRKHGWLSGKDRYLRYHNSTCTIVRKQESAQSAPIPVHDLVITTLHTPSFISVEILIDFFFSFWWSAICILARALRSKVHKDCVRAHGTPEVLVHRTQYNAVPVRSMQRYASRARLVGSCWGNGEVVCRGVIRVLQLSVRIIVNVLCVLFCCCFSF